MKITPLILMFTLLLFYPVFTLYAQWETVFFTEAEGVYAASSELDKPADFMNFGEYSPKNLLDGSLDTSWVEGEAGTGAGSYVLIGLPGDLKKYILINNGYQKSESLFLKNNRVKDFKLSLYSGFTSDMRAGQIGFEADLVQISSPVTLTLKDKMAVQPFEIPFETSDVAASRESELTRYTRAHPGDPGFRDFLIMKFEIVSVYPGSQWDDTCIAGIHFADTEAGTGLNPGEQVKEVRISADSQKIYLQTSEDRTLLLTEARDTPDGEFLTFTLSDVSPDKMWAVITEQHGSTGGGRIEETYQLWSLQRMKEVPAALMKAYDATPMDFTIRSGRLFLETFEGKRVLLEDIDLDMEGGNW